MSKEEYVLTKIFTPTNLKLLEYIIRHKEEGTQKSLYDLAKEIKVSPTSLLMNYRKLVDAGILIVREQRTKNGICKVLELDYENELVDILIKTFETLILVLQHTSKN